MNYNKLKRSAENIHIPDDSRKRIIRNCRSIAENQSENEEYTDHIFTVDQYKPSIFRRIAGITALCAVFGIGLLTVHSVGRTDTPTVATEVSDGEVTPPAEPEDFTVNEETARAEAEQELQKISDEQQKSEETPTVYDTELDRAMIEDLNTMTAEMLSSLSSVENPESEEFAVRKDGISKSITSLQWHKARNVLIEYNTLHYTDDPVVYSTQYEFFRRIKSGSNTVEELYQITDDGIIKISIGQHDEESGNGSTFSVSFTCENIDSIIEQLNVICDDESLENQSDVEFEFNKQEEISEYDAEQFEKAVIQNRIERIKELETVQNVQEEKIALRMADGVRATFSSDKWEELLDVILDPENLKPCNWNDYAKTRYDIVRTVKGDKREATLLISITDESPHKIKWSSSVKDTETGGGYGTGCYYEFIDYDRVESFINSLIGKESEYKKVAPFGSFVDVYHSGTPVCYVGQELSEQKLKDIDDCLYGWDWSEQEVFEVNNENVKELFEKQPYFSFSFTVNDTTNRVVDICDGFVCFYDISDGSDSTTVYRFNGVGNGSQLISQIDEILSLDPESNLVNYNDRRYQ